MCGVERELALRLVVEGVFSAAKISLETGTHPGREREGEIGGVMGEGVFRILLISSFFSFFFFLYSSP